MTIEERKELLDRSLYELEKAIILKSSEYSIKLRAAESGVVFPGRSILLSTGISADLLRDYEETITLSRLFQTKSWIRVTPFLIRRGNIAMVDIQNFSQDSLALRNEYARNFDGIGSTDMTIRTLDDLEKQEEGVRMHVAHEILEGDEIGTLTVRRR